MAPAQASAIMSGSNIGSQGTVPSSMPANAGAVPAQGSASSIIQSGRVSSSMGMRVHPITGAHKFHAGTDNPAPAGTPFKSRYGGTVKSINGYGDVTVENDNGTTSTYRHVDPNVKVGQKVTPDTVLGGLKARDPRSTGPHLHEELRDAKGNLVDTGKMDAEARARANAQVANNSNVKLGGYPAAMLERGGAGSGVGLAASLSSQPDRAALTASQDDATRVRADGNVTVKVGANGAAQSAAGDDTLFAKTSLQSQTAGQLTQHGANVADVANDYMARKVASR